MKVLWIVELYPGVWLGPRLYRETQQKDAKRFGSIHGARVALGLARKSMYFQTQKFPNARIEKVKK